MKQALLVTTKYSTACTGDAHLSFALKCLLLHCCHLRFILADLDLLAMLNYVHAQRTVPLTQFHNANCRHRSQCSEGNNVTMLSMQRYTM